MPPVSCPDLFLQPNNQESIFLGIDSEQLSHKNKIPMSILRWFFFILTISIGIVAGAFYGLTANPIQFVDNPPATLREDFRADYTLMTAEIYNQTHNLNDALLQLSFFDDQTPDQVLTTALNFANQNGFAVEDINLLHKLQTDLTLNQPGASPISTVSIP